MLSGGRTGPFTEEPEFNVIGSYLFELEATITCADFAFFESLMSLTSMANKQPMATMTENEVTKISMTFILFSEKSTALNDYSLIPPLWISGIENSGLALDLPIEF
jgi:hypothetical protein